MVSITSKYLQLRGGLVGIQGASGPLPLPAFHQALIGNTSVFAYIILLIVQY